MASTDKINQEIERLVSQMIFAGVSLEDAIRELKLNYAAQLEEIAERARKSA